MPYFLKWLLSSLSSVLRAGGGLRGTAAGERPAEQLVLYEFEGCPYCRKAREAVTALDLEVEIRPCPKRGERFRSELIARGGKAQFPYLVDPNAGDERYESGAIVRLLFARYGQGPRPVVLLLGPLGDILSSIAQLPRLGAGTFVRPSREAAAMPTLYAFEASPGGRLVRERLAELEVRYRLVPTGLGGRNRAALLRRAGSTAVRLEDPDRGDAIVGAQAILDHLDERFGAS